MKQFSKFFRLRHISLYSLITAAGAAALTSCDSKEKNTTTLIEEKKEIIWNWKEYPQASELNLRTMPVDVQPKQSFEIKSEASGIITIMPTEKTTLVEKGYVIAKMDVDTLTEQEERLQLQEEKQFLDEMKDEKLNIPQKRKQATEDLAEAKRKVRLLKMVLNNPAMAEMSQELIGGDIGTLNKNSLKEAEDSLKLAEKKLEWAEKFDEKIRQGQLRLQEMDMTENKRKHQDAKDRSIYTAPFKGELRLEVNFIKDQDEYTVGGRETIATLNDYEEIHALVKVANSKWITLQPERLYIQLKNKANTLMTFHEDRIDKDERTRKEERKYIFTVPLKNNESLKRLAGTQMQSELVYKLPETCYIVPKYDLSLYAYGKTKSIDWSTMTKELWPTAAVIAEGRTHVAIKLR